MMSKEQWVKWEPIEDLASVHYIETISDRIDTLVLTLFERSGEKKRFQLIFDDTVIGYRDVEEGLRLQISENCIQDGGIGLYGHWTFFKAINSSYMRWLKEQSGSTPDLNLVTHFVLVSGNSIVDVAAVNEPIIKYID